MSAPQRIHLMSGLILIATFLAGAATGLGLSGGPRHHRPWARASAHGRPPWLHELALTPEQEAAAEPIFARHRDALEAVMRESFPRVRAVNDEMEAELKALLTPEQVGQLEALKARHGPGRHGGPWRPPPSQ